MLALFCLRLACGLVGSLLLFSPAPVNPRFYRAHFLTILGLTAVATLFLWESAAIGLRMVLCAGIVLDFLGSLVWSLERAPGGRWLSALTVAALIAALALTEWTTQLSAPAEHAMTRATHPAWLFVGDLTSAALLGTATTAMLMGHSYLIAPAMSLTPLLRLLGAFLVALLVRLAVAGLGLWSWTAGHSLANLEDETVLWLPVRWGLGFAGPLVLGWMAWQTARIRSTQSATGILYVVVILCFLGELTSQVLLGSTGIVL